MGTPEPSDGGGPGPLPAVVGGVIAALVLIWLVDVVVGTLVFLVKLVAFVAVVVAGFWAWGKLSRD